MNRKITCLLILVCMPKILLVSGEDTPAKLVPTLSPTIAPVDANAIPIPVQVPVKNPISAPVVPQENFPMPAPSPLMAAPVISLGPAEATRPASVVPVAMVNLKCRTTCGSDNDCQYATGKLLLPCRSKVISCGAS